MCKGIGKILLVGHQQGWWWKLVKGLEMKLVGEEHQQGRGLIKNEAYGIGYKDR